MLLTTQYLEEADQLADRVAVIDRGRIVAEGSPHELKARVGEEVVEIRVRRRDRARRACRRRLARLRPAGPGRADRDGGPDTHVVLRRPTLDDVFLTLTQEVAA